MKSGTDIHKFSMAGMLITIGIIFGDIGTSPLYVLRAIVGTRTISESLVLGALSCIFWTLTIQTTVKYVIITLQADNKGEGGIFSLYALLRRFKLKTLAILAMIGGSALLADGMITPPISISSAIEGLHHLNEDIPVIPIVIGIIFFLFFIQQFGTGFVGRSFGPIMMVWFLMIGTLGATAMVSNPGILKALNPMYAIHLLTMEPGGFWLLGGVFLCTTGAEALYSDLGHCGRDNIRVSWIFVKTTLLLNYFGQGAWLLSIDPNSLGDQNPFYAIMPQWFVFTGVIVATLAAIVASQALISGSFTLVNEAIRLNFMTKHKIIYPTDVRGQLYIPAVNWLLMVGCIGVVLHFRESSNMEAAYGMAIIITMMVTSTLLIWYLKLKHVSKWVIALFILLYGTIEGAFLISNLDKIPHGGWITLVVSSGIFFMMYCWMEGRRIRNRYLEFTDIREYLPLLHELRNDTTIPQFSTHLAYLTSANNEFELENAILYSMFQKRPKRADVYWLLHVDVTDDPYRMEYKVTHFVDSEVIKIDFRLGFRIEPRINLFFRQVVTDMKNKGEVNVHSRYESLSRQNMIGDFRFVVIEKFMSYDNVIGLYEKIMLSVYNIQKKLGLTDEKAFGLDTSNVLIEKVPIVISAPTEVRLKRT